MAGMKKLFAGAANRNKDAILKVLMEYLSDSGSVLEIASGPGQHIMYFAEHFPSYSWQPSDIDESNINSINAYIADSKLANVKKPLCIDISQTNFFDDEIDVDIMLNINMMHISPLACTIGLFQTARRKLKLSGKLITYGPYAVNGLLTPESNIRFDASLKHRNSEWGIRDITFLQELATNNKMFLKKTVEMPSNNKCLIFEKCIE